MAIFVFAVLLGLIPASIARGKGRDFVRWWVYGAALFIVALPHALLMKADEGAIEQRAVSEGGRKKCPFCAELIKSEAVVCRFCGRNLGQRIASQVSDIPASGDEQDFYQEEKADLGPVESAFTRALEETLKHEEQPQTRRKSGKGWLVLAAIATVGMTIIGSLLIIQKSKPAAPAFEQAGRRDIAAPVYSSPQTQPARAPLADVILNLTVELAEGNRRIIKGTTNLPDGTQLMISVERPAAREALDSTERYPAQLGSDKSVVQDGAFTSGPFGPSAPLPGHYEADAVMPFAHLQPPAVRAIIGERGENLTGPLVRNNHPVFGKNVSAKTQFQVGDAIAIDTAARQEIEARKKAGTLVAKMQELVQKGRAMQSVRGQEACLDLMDSYRKEVEFLAAQAESIPSDFGGVFPWTRTLSAGTGSLSNCVSCLDTAVKQCDVADRYLQDAAEEFR